MEPTVETLAIRLDRVERENRWMKRIGCLALVGIAAVAMMGQSQCNLPKNSAVQGRANKVLEAQEFVVRDGDGKERARLTDSGLAFIDPNGGIRADLLVTSLKFSDEKRVASFGICSMDQQCYSSAYLNLVGNDTTITVDTGSPRSGEWSGSAPLMKIAQREGYASLASNRLALYGRKKQQIQIDAGGDGANFDLLDENGKHRATLGSTLLTDVRTGTVTKTAESSLVLFDKDGKVIWRTP